MLQKPAFFVFCGAVAVLAAHACFGLPIPAVDRVEPPNWWAGSTLNPVRLLLHGRDLSGAAVTVRGPGLSVSHVKVSADGNYLFADVTLAPHVTPGLRTLEIKTPGGTVDAPFTVSTPLALAGRFQGFSPDDIMYLIMPDRFSDGDISNDDPPSAPGLYRRDNPHLYHGGDFQGIANHLGYLKDLGVTAIWITPVYQNTNRSTSGPDQLPSSDFHGYAAVNLYAIDPHFGDMAGLRALVDKAHALGLKVIQDEVANHVGIRHPWVTDPPTSTWFNGTTQNHVSNPYQVWSVMDPHATAAERDPTVDGWFNDFMPDLNQNDPEVARYEIQNTLWWINMVGFDGIREDTFPFVPRVFWQQWSAAIRREHPHVNAVGEVFEGDPAQVAYFQGGRIGPDGVDTGVASLFDYPLYYPLRRVFAQGNSFTDVAQDEAHDWLFPHPNQLVTLLGDHDVKRFLAEDGATVAGLELADTFLLTNRGIPLVYYGDEIGMTGGDDPDNRRDFPGGFPGDPHDAFTVAGRTPQEQEIWQHVRTLAHLRAALPPLRRGEQKTLYLTDKQWAYARILGRDAVVVALNNDHSPATFTIPVTPNLWPEGTSVTDQLGRVAPASVTGGRLTITLPAQTGAVFAR